MRIDAYTHFFPKKFFDTMLEVAGQYKDMGKRVRAIPALHDLDARKKIIDTHKDYQQVIAYPQPPIEKFAKSPQQIDEFVYRFARFYHEHDAPRFLEHRDHLFDGVRSQHLGVLGLFIEKIIHLRNRPVEGDHREPVVVHVQNQILAHNGQPDYSNISFRFHVGCYVQHSRTLVKSGRLPDCIFELRQKFCYRGGGIKRR